MKHKAVGALGVLVAIMMLGGACTSDDEPKKELADGCVLDSECAGELVCFFGHCHSECAESSDCSDDARCVKVDDDVSVCQLPDEVECKKSSDCPDPLVCGDDNECRNECEEDDDCAEGQKCSEQKVCAEPEEVDEKGDLIFGAGGASPGSGKGEGGAGGSTGGDTSTDEGGAGPSSSGDNGGAGGAPATGGSSQSEGGSPATGGSTSSEAGSPATGGSSQTEGGSPATGGSTSSEAGSPGTGGQLEVTETELVVTPDGGTVDAGSLQVVVPEGAVSSDTEFAVQAVASTPIALPVD